MEEHTQVVRLCAEAHGIPFNRLDLLIPNAPNTSGVYSGAPPKYPNRLIRPQSARDMLNNLGNSPNVISTFHKQMIKTPPQIKVPSGSVNSANQSYLNAAMSFGKGLAQNIFVGNSAVGLVSPNGEVIDDDDERFDPELVKDDTFEKDVFDEVAQPEKFKIVPPALPQQPQYKLPVAEFELDDEEPIEYLSKSQRRKIARRKKKKELESVLPVEEVEEIEYVDPEEFEFKRGRGRPKGSKSGTREPRMPFQKETPEMLTYTAGFDVPDVIPFPKKELESFRPTY